MEVPLILAWVDHLAYCELFADPMDGVCNCGLAKHLEELGFTYGDVEEARDTLDLLLGD